MNDGLHGNGIVDLVIGVVFFVTHPVLGFAVIAWCWMQAREGGEW